MQNKMKHRKGALSALLIFSVANTLSAGETQGDGAKPVDPACQEAVGQIGQPTASNAPATPGELAALLKGDLGAGSTAMTPATPTTSALAVSMTTMKSSIPPLGKDADKMAQQTAFAKKLAAGLKEFDPTDLESQADMRTGMRQFDRSIIALAPSIQSTSLDATIKSLNGTQAGNDLATQLIELDKTMSALKIPATFEEPAKGFFGRIGQAVKGAVASSKLLTPLQKFFMEYKTAAEVIGKQMEAINTGVTAEETKIDGEYQNNANDISASIVNLGRLEKFLKMLFEEVEGVYNTMDPASDQAKFIKKEVLTHIADRRKSTMDMIVTLQQAETALLLLIDTGRDLTTKARDEASKAKVAIDTGVIIARAIDGQQRILKATKAIKKTGETIQTQNAKNLLAHAMEVNGFLLDMTNIDSFVENANTYEEIRRQREETQAKRLDALKTALPTMEQVRDKMQKMIAEQRKEIGLDSEIGGSDHGTKPGEKG